MFQPIDPESYLHLARALASNGAPAAKRTAADRAYYAAFLFAREQLCAKGYLTPYYGTDDHKYVAERLKSLDALGWSGNDEDRLRKARNKITYDTRILESLSVDWFLTTAENIIAKVKALPSARK